MPNELDFSGFDDEEEWTEPTLHGDTMDDFGVPDDQQWDELPEVRQDEIEDNFLLGEDVDDFGDLALPVVDPEGDVDPANDQLNEQGLAAADARVFQVEGFSQDELEAADQRIQGLQRMLEED